MDYPVTGEELGGREGSRSAPTNLVNRSLPSTPLPIYGAVIRPPTVGVGEDSWGRPDRQLG